MSRRSSHTSHHASGAHATHTYTHTRTHSLSSNHWEYWSTFGVMSGVALSAVQHLYAFADFSKRFRPVRGGPCQWPANYPDSLVQHRVTLASVHPQPQPMTCFGSRPIANASA